jgi:hypothetical protein
LSRKLWIRAGASSPARNSRGSGSKVTTVTGKVERCALLGQLRDHGLVPPMHAIERPDRGYAGSVSVTQAAQAAKELHGHCRG